MTHIGRRKHPTSGSSFATKASLGAALLAGGLASCPVCAQEGAAQPVKAPEGAVVTLPESQVIGTREGYLKEYVGGAKFTTPVSKTPKTIQIIDQQVMQDQQTTTLTEALRNSPGVGAFAMGETGSSSTGDAVYIRGVDASGSIFVDGIRDAGSITRDTFNIQQVEVVKGADGSMFGRTALNGTVNMVTKQAHDNDQTIVNLSGGTKNQKRATLDFNRKLGDTTALRLNVVGQDSGVPGRDKVKRRVWGIAPSLAFGLGTDTRLYLDYLHVNQNNQPDGGLAMLGLPGYHADPAHPEFADAPRVRSRNYYGTESDYDKVQQDQLTARFEKELNPGMLFHNTARWGRTSQEYVLSSLQSDWNSSWDLNDLSNWTATRNFNSKDQVNTILTNQTGIVQELKTGAAEHTLSYGVELSYERVRKHDLSVDPAASNFPINIYHPSYSGGYTATRTGTGVKAHTTTLAGYLFDTVKLGDRWQFNGGLRLDHYRARYQDSGTTDPNLANAKKNENLLSWQLGTLYNINRWGNVYAQYAIAQQPPGTDGLVLERKAKYPDRMEYKPQKARTLELGTKWKLANDNLLFSASLFRTDISNQVETDPVSSDLVQTGKKRVQGLDLALVGRITPAWDVTLGYTHQNAKVVRGAIVAKDGSDALLYTPKNAFTGWTTYRFGSGLAVGGGVRYVSKMQRDNKGTPATPEAIDSYWVADAMVSYAVTKNVDIQLNGYNLFNKRYVAAINKKGHRYIPGLERSFVLSANLRF